MALQLDTVAHACNLITREIRDYQKNLTVHFIVHHEGQRTEALGMAAQDILPHPASETAMHLLQKQRRSEDSALLGTAVARKNILFGLSSRDLILALCTINVDQFSSLKEAQRMAYHLGWHALDAVEYHGDPRNRTGGSTEVIIRQRNALEMACANLRADVFSCVVSSFHRDREAVRRLALMRGLNALHTRSLHGPEYYPFVIAMEATEYALSQVDPSQVSKKRIVPTALRVANEVSQTYDEITLKHWLAFAEPAQDMAWRGYDEAMILSAAINTSPNTYVRATGYLISELAAIDPASIIDISESYSPFADSDFNAQLHDKLVDNIYQDIIAQGLKQNSSVPFTNMANQQNAALTEGRVMGWCAPALHAAGEAYDDAREKGMEPEPAATQEFEATKESVNWEDLDELGKRVIKSHRQGDTVTISDLQDISRDIEGLKSLRRSVERTMNDPQYKQKLAAVQEMTPERKHDLSGPSREAAPKKGPVTPAHAVSVPGLGRTAKQPQQNTQQQNEDSQQ